VTGSAELVDEILAELLDAARDMVGDEAGVSPDVAPAAFGVDSVGLLTLQRRLSTGRTIDLDPEDVFGATLREIAQAAAEQVGSWGGTDRGHAPERAAGPGITFGQRGLWFLEQLADTGGAYNIAGAVRCGPRTEVHALTEALVAVLGRHPQLCAAFDEVAGEIVRIPGASPEVVVADMDPGWDGVPHEVLVEQALRPLPLDTGPLARAVVWAGAPSATTVLLVVHHVVADFWSLGVLLEQVAEVYTALVRERPLSLPPADDGADFARRQQEWVDSPEGARAAEYWREVTDSGSASIDLVTDRPRPARQTFRGARVDVDVDEAGARALADIARRRGTTSFVVVQALWHLVLHRFTQQDDLVVGSPTSGRDRSATAASVGYLINPVAIRSRPRPSQTLGSFVDDVASTVTAAMAHSRYPFPLVAERAAHRDPSRSPVFSTMVMFQQAQSPELAQLARLAVGRSGPASTLGELELAPLDLELPTTQFDLVLTVCEEGERYLGALSYNTDLFDQRTAAALADAFTVAVRNASELLGDALVRGSAVWPQVRPGPPTGRCRPARPRGAPTRCAPRP